MVSSAKVMRNTVVGVRRLTFIPIGAKTNTPSNVGSKILQAMKPVCGIFKLL